MPQFDVLATLWHGEGITQQELAERLLVPTKGNVVGLIDRGQHGRMGRATPRPRGPAGQSALPDRCRAKLLAEAWPSQVALNQKIFGTLTEGELRLMHELLEHASRDCWWSFFGPKVYVFTVFR